MTKKPSSHAALRNWIFGMVQLIAVIGIVGGTVVISDYMKNNQAARVQIDPQIFVPVIQTMVVRTEDRVIPITKTGTVEASVYVSITPSVSGVVESVADGLGGGAVFNAGDVLFRIDRDDLEIEVQRREADLASARASLDIEQAQGENARREWESFGRGDITDLAARGPQIRQAEAQVMAAEASLSAAMLDLERSGFALPFDGRIVDLSLALGQKLSEGQSYGTVYSFDEVIVLVSLSADELALLDPVIGTKADINAVVLGRDVTLSGKISRVAGELDRTTRLTDLVITLDPAEVRRLQLQPGTFVTVTLSGPQISDLAEIPNTALQQGDSLWLVEGDRLVRFDDISIVLRGRSTSLVSGLPDGARIAVGATGGATADMTVRYEDQPFDRQAQQTGVTR